MNHQSSTHGTLHCSNRIATDKSMGKMGTKKLRGSRGARVSRVKDYCDLMVPLPKTTDGLSSLECKLLIKELRDRLSSTGFTHMALTHTIYGRPKTDDRAAVAIPSSLWTSSEEEVTKQKNKKKRKLQDVPKTDSGEKNAIRILRRLHVVLENQSDMGFYLSNGPQEDLLNEYDVISLAPTNEITFQSACSSATMADIITLDYTTRGLRLPYRIRSNDVKAAFERGATFEIPIAPALIHLKQRRALVHACQELKNNCLGLKPRIIVSSGDRTLDGTDVGALALRIPGDISNLCKTVMHFDDVTASNAVGTAGLKVLQRGKDRRFGQRRVTCEVSLIRKKDLTPSSRSLGEKRQSNGTKILVESDAKSEEIEETLHDSDDGFIAL